MDLPYPPPLESGRAKILRKRPLGQRKHIKAYAEKTGPILWEWNALHAQFFLVFCVLLGLKSGSATSLWHTVSSDDMQRRMLRVLAEGELKSRKPELKRLLWVLDIVGKIATYRNNAAHLPMSFQHVQGRSAHPTLDILSIRPAAGLRDVLMRINGPKFSETLAEDLFVLGQYTILIGVKIVKPDAFSPWPRKPKMRSLPNIQAVNNQVAGLLAKIGRSRPRRASRR